MQVVEVDPALSVGVGRDHDHPSPAARLEPAEDQVREQERREVVDGERPLDPVGVTWRVCQYPPTLLTRTSIRGRRSSASVASRRTSDWMDRSAVKTWTVEPVTARISAAVRARGPRPVR